MVASFKPVPVDVAVGQLVVQPGVLRAVVDGNQGTTSVQSCSFCRRPGCTSVRDEVTVTVVFTQVVEAVEAGRGSADVGIAGFPDDRRLVPSDHAAVAAVRAATCSAGDGDVARAEHFEGFFHRHREGAGGSSALAIGGLVSDRRRTSLEGAARSRTSNLGDGHVTSTAAGAGDLNDALRAGAVRPIVPACQKA